MLPLVVLHVVAVQLREDISDARGQRGPEELHVRLDAEVQEQVDALPQGALHSRGQGDLGRDTLSVRKDRARPGPRRPDREFQRQLPSSKETVLLR